VVHARHATVVANGLIEQSTQRKEVTMITENKNQISSKLLNLFKLLALATAFIITMVETGILSQAARD
jgi:hypothetical protein